MKIQPRGPLNDTASAETRARAHAEYAEKLLADMHNLDTGRSTREEANAARTTMSQAAGVHATLALYYQHESSKEQS